MITGRVITASVQEAASIERAHVGEEHEGPHAEQPVHDARHARQVHHRQVDDPREPVVAGVFVEINARPVRPRGAATSSEIKHQEERAHQRRPDAAGGHVVLGVLQQRTTAESRPCLEQQDTPKIADQRQTSDKRHAPGARIGRSFP